ncbi:MAG: gliding motility-associated C-terminal domain-containing protein [Chitinophagales bacterium]|nr:gliding motility-associated C-terminal domain-containing protein [Chitinophagales bacterium]
MEKRYLLTGLHIAFLFLGFHVTKLSAQSNCSNVDFESGTFAGWTGYTGSCCPINANVAGIVAGRHTITSGTGVDPWVPTIPVVSPFGGTYSCMLGNSGVGYQAERLTFTFPVTAANPNFTYQYAVILQDPNHTAADQPRFQVNIKNQSGQTIPCGFYNVVAGAGIPGFQSTQGGTLIYKEWSLVAVDLTNYIGQNITVEFQTGDCGQGGHFGYAYIDASCNPLQITTNYCPGDQLAALTAPPGFQFYQWSTGQTTQSITVTNPTPGDSITVLCTPFQGANCATTLKYKFLQFPPVDANYSVNTSCGNNQVVFTDSSSIIVNGAQITGWQWIINNQVVSTDQSFTYSFPGPGNYNVTLIASSNAGCPDTVTKQVFIPQGLDAITTIPTSVTYNGYGVSCVGASDGSASVSASFGALPYSFVWSNGSTNTAISNLSPGTYIVTVTDNAGCQNIDSAVITAPPAIQIAPALQHVVCYGDNTGSIQLNPTGGVGTLSYQWLHNGSLNAPNATSLAAGNYQFTITDANNCALSNSETLNQPAAPFNVQTSITDATCFGFCNGAINITSVTGNTSPYNFVWSTNPVQNTQSAQNLCVGSYTCTISDQNNCTTTTTNTIAQPTQLNISIAKTDVLCFGDATGTAVATVTGSIPPYTYSWDNGSANSAAGNLAIGNYSVTVTDANSCSISSSVIITEPPQLTVTLSHQDAQCFGYNTGKVFSNVSGGVVPYNFLWSTAPAQTQANAVNLVAGSYSVTITDAHNCTVSASETVGEPTLLTVNIASSVDNVCYGGNTGSATSSANGGTLPYSYNWNTNPVQTAATATSLIAGSYSLTVTDDSLCTATVSVVINQPTQIIISETVNPALCFDSAQGSIVMNVSQGTPGYTYTWQPNVSSTNTAVDLLAGNYVVTVTDNNNCTMSRTYTIQQPTQLTIAVAHTDALCNGSADGTVTVTQSSGGTPPYTYQLLQAGSVIANNSTGVFTGLAAGSYSGQFTDAHSCIINQPVVVSHPTPLVIQTISADSVNCHGYSDGSISVTASGATPPYVYVMNNNVTNASGSFNNLIQGTYAIDIYDAHNCHINTTAIVNEPTPIILVANPDSLVMKLGETKPVTITSNYDPNANYQWEPWDGLDCTNCPTANVTRYGNYLYRVTVTTHPHDLDCTNDIDIPVTVIPNYDVFIPNVFTPNGDGVNDVFEFFGNKAAIKQLNILVFNRTGEKVFESNDLNFKWDGTYKGTLQPPGVYVYHMKLVFMDNHSENGYKGSVTLLR